MPRRTTIKDIASECGVSLSTVSLVLNNSKRISEATRAKVLQAVKKHNYQPNHQAQALVSRASRVISVTIPDLQHVFADIYFGEIVSGLYDEASEHGYKLLLDIARDHFVENREYLRLLETRRVDGMLFIGASVDDAYLYEFEGAPHPFLLVNHFFPGRQLNYIMADYTEAAYLAADHLLNLGHRRIGLIVGTNTHTGLHFRDAFIARLREAGIDEPSSPWVASEWDEPGGFLGAEELFTKNPGLTAIMAANDRIAMGAMRRVRTLRKTIPDEISILGMDNIPASAYTTPGLTSISLDLYRVGRTACARLLEIVRGERTTCEEVTPVRFIERESTGRAPDA